MNRNGPEFDMAFTKLSKTIAKTAKRIITADYIRKLTEKEMKKEFCSRCSEYEPTCFSCLAWHIWDLERELKTLKFLFDNP